MRAKTEITPLMFVAAVGYLPTNDDLERCNCPKAGQIMHQQCGWNYRLDCPEFVHPSDQPVLLNYADAHDPQAKT
jgi:hypothetical protein